MLKQIKMQTGQKPIKGRAKTRINAQKYNQLKPTWHNLKPPEYNLLQLKNKQKAESKQQIFGQQQSQNSAQ